MWALDIILLILVSVCTWYCWLLNKRIKSLQSSKDEFASMIQELDQSVTKAREGVDELHALSNASTTELKDVASKADELKGELLMLNKVGNNLADRLEDRVAVLRDKPDSATKVDQKPKAKKSSATTKAKQHAIVPEHKDEYDPEILHITTDSGDKNNMDQNSYFESLKKVSIKK